MKIFVKCNLQKPRSSVSAWSKRWKAALVSCLIKCKGSVGPIVLNPLCQKAKRECHQIIIEEKIKLLWMSQQKIVI